MNDSQSTPPGKATPPRWLLPVIALLVLLGALVLGILLRPPQGAANTAPTAAPTLVRPTPETATLPSAHGDTNAGPPIERIAIADARALYDQGTAVFVDVRTGDEYAAGHIADATSITSSDLEARLKSLPSDGTIITYCTRPDEELSVRAAQIFIELGYTNVVALKGGLQAWQDQGYPIATGR